MYLHQKQLYNKYEEHWKQRQVKNYKHQRMQVYIYDKWLKEICSVIVSVLAWLDAI